MRNSFGCAAAPITTAVVAIVLTTSVGGSAHGAWPDHGVGFSYAMNEMRDDPTGDPRSRGLLRALYEAVVCS